MIFLCYYFNENVKAEFEKPSITFVSKEIKWKGNTVMCHCSVEVN